MAHQGTSLGHAERLRIRNGNFTSPTSGLAPGNLQANLAILPKEPANDFLRFCKANPKPCPRGCHSRRADHFALPNRSWRTGASRAA